MLVLDSTALLFDLLRSGKLGGRWPAVRFIYLYYLSILYPFPAPQLQKDAWLRSYIANVGVKWLFFNQDINLCTTPLFASSTPFPETRSVRPFSFGNVTLLNLNYCASIAASLPHTCTCSHKKDDCPAGCRSSLPLYGVKARSCTFLA
jgi:hypothetical protein